MHGLPSTCSESGDQVEGPEIDGTTTTTTFRPEFYEAYRRQAKIFDKELKEYNKELNVTLLLVSGRVFRPENVHRAERKLIV